MNISEAKQELCNTLRAYHRKDEEGNYRYPLIRQRPILLMGPPGIGKTAIMEQVARECGVGLVAYTITHHTRQSAIGLPHIERKTYDGREVSVTEYTLSEIIASVYECMEQTGHREGILFIDEINCVSETLAPTMLQFLQNKTFGSHKVPEGWMIVAAGNPPEYNKSVREFDIVTLDRVRRIDIDVDCSVWMEYGWSREIHEGILSYLSIKPENFYRVENTVDGKFFVTARGWEDLSEILKSYEELEVEITPGLIIQYLQQEETARDFAAYYQLYRKYGTDYKISEILRGELGDEDYEERTAMAQKGSFEERFTVVGLMLGGLNRYFREYGGIDSQVTELHRALSHLKEYLNEKDASVAEFREKRKKALEIKEQAGLADYAGITTEEWILGKLQNYDLYLRKEHLTDPGESFEAIRKLFREEVQRRAEKTREIQQRLENAFAFVEECFGQGQEMILFVTGLSQNDRAMEFISNHGCQPYFRYSEQLLFGRQEEELLKECNFLL